VDPLHLAVDVMIETTELTTDVTANSPSGLTSNEQNGGIDLAAAEENVE